MLARSDPVLLSKNHPGGHPIMLGQELVAILNESIVSPDADANASSMDGGSVSLISPLRTRIRIDLQ